MGVGCQASGMHAIDEYRYRDNLKFDQALKQNVLER
jgi:hypothetical protein